MKLAYFDCPSGASGDMILGALVDAGCPIMTLEAALRALGVEGWRLEARPVERGGLRGTHLVVETDPGRRFDTLGDMLRPIGRAALPDSVKSRASAVLRRLAEAEARVHRVPVDAVHFHEVGALDTLVDVVGAVAGLDALGVDRMHVSPLPLGGGTVDTAHGRLPVPAPATAELLRGFPVYDNGVAAELVTPTGAAILTTLGTPARLPPMTLEQIGWGAGTRELPIPNLLRVLVGQVGAAATDEAGEVETLITMETTIDDMSPQLYEPLVERLLAAGALDVYLSSVVMKRSRPGIVVTALAPPGVADRLAELLFQETTTIGVRWSEVRRRRLPRELVRLPTTLGPVTFKVSTLGGRVVTVTPEFEEVRRIADREGRPVREVLETVRQEGLRALELDAGARGARED
jgi:pyridinium-3,5-bisthiocarboxylic acid mononucleotide nickel chelatase